MAPLILIIEDEKDLASTLEYNLQREGYRVRTALNGTDGLRLAHQKPIPELVLLDLMLPDMSGIQVCRELKADSTLSHIPVLMATARGEEIDRVVGFEVGADDYVVKPYSIRELVLRIGAILRRTNTQQKPDNDSRAERVGILEIDHEGHRVWVKKAEVSLTSLEFKLLTTFLTRQGRVQSREVLLQDVWGYHVDVTTRTVDTHIKRLREKLGDAGAYIDTVRGIGYRFNKQVEGQGQR
jgi:two-component system phosphate regulon response regulator PhoB